MATYNQISMTDTAALIVASNTDRKKLMLKNIGTDNVYIGASASVVDTAANANGGYELLPNEVIYLSDYTGNYYGICSAAETSTIAFVEEDMA